MLETFFTVSAGMLGPVYAVYVGEIGGSILDIGYSWALFSVFAGILMIIMGKVEEKHKKINAAIIGYILKIFCFIGYIFVQTPMHLFIVQIFLGMSSAIIAPAYDAMYSKALRKGRETFEWGLWEANDHLSSAIAALVGTGIIYYLGFDSLFIAMTILAIIGLAVFLWLSRKIKKW